MKQPLFNHERGVAYQPIATIGRGGFATVWASNWAGLPVAIKVITPSTNFLLDWATWDREYRIHLLCLFHDYIVQSYDQFVTREGKLVLVLERGDASVQQLIDGGVQYAPKNICSIACQLLKALHHLHSIGIMHRDLTPNNVLYFRNGKFKINDFGISRFGMTHQDIARTLVGTPTWLPPELINNCGSSFQSDIYQIGLILLSLLLGQEPLPRYQSFDDTITMIQQGLPRYYADLAVPVYGNVAKCISKMICRTLSLRYATAAEAYQDFYTEYCALDLKDRLTKAIADLKGATNPVR